ncbi:MAG: hypothetical protein K6F30_06235 [Lachnospiraceae bacterium]|nr:hypothetical protein [Lachnospiraceae bacterium]
MRVERFKMERTGLLKEGDVLSIKEYELPSSYYYMLGHAYAMSANYGTLERIKSTEGTVQKVEKTEKGYYVDVALDE